MHKGSFPAAPKSLESLVHKAIGSTPELMAGRVAKTPDAPFLHWSGRKVTFSEAQDLIQRLATYINQFIKDESELRVAGYLSNCPEAVISWLGTHTANAVYVALNRSHCGILLDDILARSRPTILITESSAISDLPTDLSKYGVESVIFIDKINKDLKDFGVSEVVSFTDATARTSNLEILPSAHDLATIMFTSGTTGPSKAVCIPHGMLVRGGARVAEALGYASDDVFHGYLPQFHIVSHLHMILGMVVAGGSVALFPSFSLSRFWREVEQVGCTIFSGLPFQVSLFLEGEPSKNDRNHTLRFGLVGPQPSPEIRVKFEQRFGIQLRDTYGMTEIEPLTLPIPGQYQPLGSCGKANPDFELAILDQDGWHVAVGEKGELVARPLIPSIMTQGYLDDPESTLKLFKNLWLYTGDLAKFDKDGWYYILGRIKHMIRRRGENISAWELEKILLLHPEISKCEAVGVPSRLGEEDVKIAVVLTEGAELTPIDIHKWCAKKMAKFMIPRYIEIRDFMPLTDLGKVSKKELQNILNETWDSENI